MQIVLRILLALGFTVVYGVAALVAAGGGHGTVLPMLPLLTWIFYLAALIILDKFGRQTFYLLMALHYTHFLLLLWSLTDGLDPNDKKYWSSYPVIVIFTVSVYLVSQTTAWYLFVRSSKTKRKESAAQTEYL